MKVTYLGHAAILAEARGKRILMDPWLTDPAYHGSWWHYPPLPFRVRDLPAPDFIYISHEHADHFDPATLAQLSKDAQVVIADFRNKRFRDRIAALGFRKIRELRFGERMAWGEGLELFLIPPDRAWDDSAILITDGATTVLNVNDCHLDEATLRRLGSAHTIDLAFLTFTGASQYPGCFDFPEAVKVERWRASKQAHLEEFVTWAKLLHPKRAVPAAGNFALLPPDLVPLNTSDYVNHPGEAIEALRAAAPEIEGVQMNPGDTWTAGTGLARHAPAPDWSRRLEQIAAMSRARADEIAAYYAGEPAAPADLYERFQRYFDALLAADPAARERVGIVTWWHVDGPAGGDWVIDFRRERDWVRRGIPDDWNLRLAIEDKLLWKGVADQHPWEELVLSFRVRLARRPDRYMEGFWTWLCKLQGLARELAKARAQAA
jgi:UDP-MurNAc hydroxylase